MVVVLVLVGSELPLYVWVGVCVHTYTSNC